jgi:hypothetical protein
VLSASCKFLAIGFAIYAPSALREARWSRPSAQIVIAGRRTTFDFAPKLFKLLACH